MKNPQTLHHFSFPTDIHFGVGSRELLAAHLNQKKYKRPLLVTDGNLLKLSMTQELLEDLRGSETGIEAGFFSGIIGNPLHSQVSEGIEAFRRHQADCLIALGGGAVTDVAKAIALMIHHPGDLFDYEENNPKIRSFDQEIPFLVALPTTAGTGSEVGRAAVISDDETKIKKVIFSPRLMPPLVLADPEFTVDLPAHLTAATGMDALTHLIEAYLAKPFHPICDGIALEGIPWVAQNLATCVKDGKNLEARGYMLMASMMGAIAFQKGLGVTHSAAHALSTVCNLHHGLANGILLPFCMAFNADVAQRKMNWMAGLMGGTPSAKEGFIEHLIALKKCVGIPMYLKKVGVKTDQIDDLVKIAFQDGCHQLNPKPVSQKDFHTIFKEAIG